MGMNQTPASERVHVSFFGKRNAGKSSIINAVTGQDLAIVSSVMGTTTDPVYKTMELLPLGPVMVIDTPGIDDEGELGALRIRKSYQVLNKTDIAILVIDSTAGKGEEELELIHRFHKKGIPYLKDAFLPALKDGHYAKAFEAYGQSSAKLLAYYQEKGKAYDPADAFSPLALVVALVLAVGGGVAFRAYLISRMSNVRQAAAADAYVDAGSFHLTDSSDTFVFMTVQHIAKARPADDDLPDFDSDADCSDDDHGGGGGSF